METPKKPMKPYPVELRGRAVRMVKEHAGDHASEWAAMRTIAQKVGCTPETLRLWVRQSERDRGERAGLSSDEQARMQALEREIRELRQGEEDQKTVRWTVSPTNEILRKASAYFAAAELDHRFKP
jgi:transposase